MTLWSALISGFSFGFIIAAPVGPMSILCMNRTLRQGLLAGLATGAGIALADTCYALVTVTGFRIVNEFTSDYEFPLKLLGSLFIGYLGVRGLRKGAAESRPETGHSGVLYCMISSFLLTIANPATILSFMALAASLGSTIGGSLLLPAGIAFGSFFWWLLLTLVILWISSRLPESFTRTLSLASALILILFSLYGIISAIYSLGNGSPV
ncbi:LysE family translocator [Paenibacillus ihuae]|uniref:LysE family translocator n=1 Tax=Paenibacillus ihuae TaxID=1232431 RepID=UPI0006D57DFB|nr:LysE family transporter [Paenibacillus ihuae]